MTTLRPGVAEHLAVLAQKATLSNVDKGLVNVPLKTLMTRIGAEFDRYVVTRSEVFGAFARDTRLPQAMDPESDVDVLVVFRERGHAPAHYIAQLREFAALHYPKISIHCDGQRLYLQLLQARFELIPAHESLSGVQIPVQHPFGAAGGTAGRGTGVAAGASTGMASASGIVSHSAGWTRTDPAAELRDLQAADKLHQGLLLPVVRLAKYWNARAGHPYPSWDLERRAVAHRFSFVPKNLKAYWFDFMRSLQAPPSMPPAKAERVREMRRTLDGIDQLIAVGKPQEAEARIEAMLPLPVKLLA